MHIGLFFGSFNPIHIGHLIIANFVATNTDVDEVWFIVSPQNPFKISSSLLSENARLELVDLAISGNLKFRASNVEFSLLKPSYTINTLNHLTDTHPKIQFSIIMGSDNYNTLPEWKDADKLLNYKFFIYVRPDLDPVSVHSPNHEILRAPVLDISATVIRDFIKEGKSIRYLVPDNVKLEIEEKHYYK